MVRFPNTTRLPPDAYDTPEHVFHIVIHALEGTKPFHGSGGDRVWELVLNERERGSIHLLVACLMPAHLHALVQPRSRSVVRWVQGFKSYSTRVYAAERPQRAIWQPSFYDRRVRDDAELAAVASYIWRNPVEALLAESPAEWPWIFASEELSWVRDE